MKLQVYIVCLDCGERTWVHIFGAWDIKDVRHNCPKAYGVSADSPETVVFEISYDPPRPVF